MRAPATTLEIVEAHALRDGGRLAIHEHGVEVNYALLHAMLVRCGLELQALGLRRGDRLAVAGPGFARQLVVLLAAEALGAVTASFQAQDDADAPFLFSQVQWVFAAQQQQAPAGVRFHSIDDAFFARLAQPLPEATPAWAPLDLQEPQRISRTSGSTGASKFLLLRRQAQEHWIRMGTDVAGFGAVPRFLVLGPLLINAGFTRSSACLRHGGALLVGNGRDIASLDPSYVWGLPLQIERLLDELPPGWRAPRPVPVATFGGSVSEGLRGRIQSVFGGRIANRYGSNETSSICDDLDAEATGLLTPGVDVRILDPQGHELPAGQSGIIAVRTPGMADGYLARPEDTAAAFRDGWFFTGDVGTLVGRRRLRLLGRHDELVNVGGLKVPAHRLEADLRRQPAIADCAVLAVQLQGVALAIALVAAPGASEEEARAQVQAALQLPHPAQARVVFMNALPKLNTGKVDRMALLKILA
jgi:acyl-coenzyme A synthetase/AMP-(fatty) acid ligase